MAFCAKILDQYEGPVSELVIHSRNHQDEQPPVFTIHIQFVDSGFQIFSVLKKIV